MVKKTDSEMVQDLGTWLGVRWDAMLAAEMDLESGMRLAEALDDLLALGKEISMVKKTDSEMVQDLGTSLGVRWNAMLAAEMALESGMRLAGA